MYVAVKGGEAAIANAHALLAEDRRGATDVAELGVDQVTGQLGRAVDRVMTEGSVYDPELAGLAIKQAQGDLVEAIFLLRAYRTTLPRFGATRPVDTARMAIRRRISATFKDLPGGQVLGSTFDYTHRLLDFSLLAGGGTPEPVVPAVAALDDAMPRVTEILNHEGLIEQDLPEDPTIAEADLPPVPDLTREPLDFPADRALRLQNLARGDEGFLLALGYSTQRGYANSHPFAGEIRIGAVAVEMVPEELGFPVEIGDITLTECQMINQFHGNGEVLAQFTRGYGIGFGQVERKTMAMALVDRAMRAEELGEAVRGPAQDPEFVLYHSDNVEASGFVQHLKLPHYVDFQSELDMVRRLRRAHAERRTACEDDSSNRDAAE
ncbi:carbon-phosphorus lyase complex subunit PhnI [Tistrella sp. BH-R2-4]|uniref:Carbon-phosphorus lyase complex subunit PhnI n=1 Tax=Tistrella arctica TaxID=3133430 RepID=A0ABU9YHX8_9PROT